MTCTTKDNCDVSQQGRQLHLISYHSQEVTGFQIRDKLDQVNLNWEKFGLFSKQLEVEFGNPIKITSSHLIINNKSVYLIHTQKYIKYNKYSIEEPGKVSIHVYINKVNIRGKN